MLGVTGLVSLYGITSIGLWYLGPSFGLGTISVIVLIALILLTWPIAVLIGHYRRKSAEKKGASPPPAKEAKAARAARSGGKGAAAVPSRTYEELSRGAEEAVQWLRSTRLGGAKAGDAVYALPWFLIAGPPASGKTSLLLSSGLEFQTLPSQRRAEQHIVRPTRSCEWRITDSAVLLDTAGRYQNESPDRDEWTALAETIRKYRAERPLDGLLVAVSAERVIRLSETEIEQQAKVLRARLDELMQQVRARFPVYLVFTHADSIEGFKEFFAASNQEPRSQVWGTTIPLEKSLNAHALFDGEFDLLYDALMRRRLVRLGQPAPPARQLNIFDFPLRFGEARSKLGLFTSSLFRPNPFSESPLLRGFYFTANVVNGAAAPPPSPSKQGATTLLKDGGEQAVRAVGDGYFAGRFFKEVLLRDKDLAASFQASQKRPSRLRYALPVAAALVLFALTAVLIASFIFNKRLIAEAVERGSHVDEITRADVGKDPARKDSVNTLVELQAVDQLRETLDQLDEYDRKGPPLYMRFGLYSGNTINPPLRAIYFDSIEQRFKKPTVALLERDLRAFASGAPAAGASPSPSSTGPQSSAAASEDVLGRNYDLLKAYLMLADASKVEPTFLAGQLADYWKRSSPPDMEIISHQQLEFFARQMSSEDAPHIKVDDRLVAEARRKLVAYPAVNRFYKRVTTEINAKATPVNLDSILEGRGIGVLDSSYTVPGSFTIEGYRDHMREAFDSAAAEISKDDWVMGAQATASKDQGADVGKLQNMYFRDYADQWDKFIKGIRVRDFKSKDDAVEKLKVLSGNDSPLERVIQTVERHTNLSAPRKSSGIIGWTIGWIKSWFQSSSSEQTGGGSVVEREFRPLFQFASADAKKESTPASQYRKELRGVKDALELQTNEQLTRTSESLLTGKDDLGLQKAEQNISNLLEGFKATAGAADAAALLKQPLDNLRRLLYGRGIEQIEKTWRDQVYPRAKSLESGFPFTDAGESSVSDLSRFLNPVNGQFTSFFKDQLAQSFEDAQGQWRLKESGAVKFSDDFVKYLNSARQLREALFPNGGQQPEVGYELILQPVKDTDITVEIDGTRVETRGTEQQSAKFTWPARSGASGAKITVMQGSAQPAEKPFLGEWGLFRMFEAGGANKSGDNQFALSWNVGSVTVSATLRPSSANNPFQRSLFKSMHAPQTLQK